MEQAASANLMPMFRDPRLHPWLLTLFCVVLLMVRVDGAHLHLCFDGKEPPASFHLADFGFHYGKTPGVDASDQDADVALAGEALAKQDKSSFDLPLVLLAALLLWALLQAPRRFASPLTTPVVSTTPPFLRPPLRGPPLLTSL